MPAGGGPLDLFLARGLRQPDATTIIENAERLKNAPAPVVLVISKAPPREFWQGTRPTVLSVSELITWSPPDGPLEVRPLLGALRSIRPPISKEEWLTLTQCAQLLMQDLPYVDLDLARARVSRAANDGKFVTNGKRRDARRIERTSFDAWRLEQRDRELDAADS